MNPFFLHLQLILAGVAVALAALWYYGRVTGGLLSIAGLILGLFLTVAGALVLAGFGFVAFPGLVPT